MEKKGQLSLRGSLCSAEVECLTNEIFNDDVDNHSVVIIYLMGVMIYVITLLKEKIVI